MQWWLLVVLLCGRCCSSFNPESLEGVMANITALHDAGLELLDGGDVRGALAKLRAAEGVVDATAAEVVGSVGDAAAGGAAQTLKGMLFGSHLARIYYNQGICHKDLGQQLEAKESYLLALRYQPDFPEAHFNLGRTYQIMADDFAGPGGLYRDAVGRRAALHEAVAHFRNSSEAARPSADSFRSLEEVLAQLGEHDGARLAYGRYIELLPSKALGASLRDSCASALAWLRHREDEAGFMLAELRRQAGAPRGAIVELEHKALAALGFSLAALAPPTTLCTPWNAQAAPGRAFDEPGSGQPPALLRPVAEMAALRAQFERLGHAAVPSALAPSALAFLAAHYRALHRLSESHGGSYKGGGYGGAAGTDGATAGGAGEAGVADAILSHNRYAIDNERLARFTADRLLPLLENLTGMRLKTSFVKVAIYTEGADLPPHRDQAQCTVSVSIPVESSARGAASEHWPLVLMAAPEEGEAPAENRMAELWTGVGGLLVFRGRDFVHWRDVLGAGENSTNMLLHFVPEDFPQVHCQQLVGWEARPQLGDALPAAGVKLAQLARPAAAKPLIDHKCRSLSGAEQGALVAWRRSSAVSAVLGGYAAEADEWLDKSQLRRARIAVEGFAEVPAAEPPSAEPRVRTRYMLYSPCVTVNDAAYCNQQFNNQIQQLQHALMVATALRRVLVLPPLLWMSHQEAEQQLWFPASHFLNVSRIAENFAVIEWSEFLALEGSKEEEGGNSTVTIPYYFTPPYIIPRSEKVAYGGHFFRRNGVRWCSARRMSPHYEVKQATSGRGDSPFVVREGASYWRAAALLMPRHNAEMRALLVGGGLLPAQGGAAATGPAADCEELEAELVNTHSNEILQWRSMGSQFPRLHPSEVDSCSGAASQNSCECSPLDVVAFDFAPSHNYKLDGFDFDPVLQRVRDAIRFTDQLQAAARDLVRDLFGTSDARYGAIHLRRDGYEFFCFGRGLQYYKGKRFGYQVTGDMCFPSIAQAAAFANRAAARHGVTALLVATNSRDPQELAELERALALPFRRAPELFAGAPEHLSMVEQLLCAQATFFIGNVASTFTATVVHERDVRGSARDTLYLWGNEDARTAPARAAAKAAQQPRIRQGALLLVAILCLSSAYLLVKRQ